MGTCEVSNQPMVPDHCAVAFGIDVRTAGITRIVVFFVIDVPLGCSHWEVTIVFISEYSVSVCCCARMRGIYSRFPEMRLGFWVYHSGRSVVIWGPDGSVKRRWLMYGRWIPV